jgi:predicted branched-subunit amino acid permease
VFFKRIHCQHPEFAHGMRDSLAVAPGLAAWGLMMGVAMMKSGMSLTESLLMGVMVFAGSSQLAAIPLLIAGAPMWVILATATCVNLRFVVFSAHLRAYVMHLPLWERLVTGYLTTDLTYVMFTNRYPSPEGNDAQRLAQQAYLAGNSFVSWTAWVGCSVMGVVLANFIPTHWGLGFAGILALLGILCSLASSRLRVVSAAVAGVAAVAAFALPFKLNVLVAIAAAVALCLILEEARLARRKTS